MADYNAGREDPVTRDVENQLTSSSQIQFADPGAVIDPADRPVVSNESNTIVVGRDVNSVQDAIDAVPRILRHKWIIDLDGQTWAEHAVIQGIWGTDSLGSTQGAANHLQIENGTLTSLYVANCAGHGIPNVQSVAVTGDVSDGPAGPNESVGMHFDSVQFAAVRDCDFTGCTAQDGLMAYASYVKVGGGGTPIDLGTDDLRHGFTVKANGSVVHRDAGSTGSITGSAVAVINGYGNIEQGDQLASSGGANLLVEQGIGLDRSGRIVGSKSFQRNHLRDLGPSVVETSELTVDEANDRLLYGHSDGNVYELVFDGPV